MLRLLEWMIGTALVVIAVVFVLAWFGNDDFRERVREEIDNLLGRQDISDQAVLNLSESVVEVEATGGGQGSGVIITEQLPWTVITAEHVAREATGRVRRPGGDWGWADVVELDYERDVAVLQVDFPSRSRPVLVTSPPLAARQPEVGDLVAIRCYDTQILVGEVTGFVTRAGGHLTLVTSISSQAGCSGAPMVNVDGELVAVVTEGGGDRTLAAPYP